MHIRGVNMSEDELSLSDILFVMFFWLIVAAYALAVFGYGIYWFFTEKIGLKRLFILK